MGDNDYLIDPIKQVAENRGVDDVNALLSSSYDDVLSPLLLDNMEQAVKEVGNAIKDGKKIHIVVDSDADGVTSASILYLYLKDMGCKNITWNCHEKKVHGIFLDELEGFDFDLLIIPDAGTNDAEQAKALVDKGKRIIVLDHHEKEVENPYCLIVNPKTCNYPNKEISGAVVVYKFCEAMDDVYGFPFSGRYLDLASLGAIADMMDTRVPETRFFCTYGIQNVNNKMFKAILDKQQNKIGDKVTIQSIQFYVAPLINAVFRVGTKEELESLFTGFITTENVEVDYKKRGAGVIKVPLQDDVARELVNIKARQDRQKEKLVDVILKMASKIDDKILILNVSEVDNPEMLGLISNEIANKLHKPTLIVKDSEKEPGMMKGSGRNYNKFSVTELKSFLSDLPFELLAGHENAFGVKIHKDNFQTIVEGVVEKTKDIDTQEMYHVDFSMDGSALTLSFVKMLDKHSNIWGTQFEEPYIHVKNLKGEDIVINEKQTMISFTKGKIKYVLFHPKQEDIDALVNKTPTLEVIGRASISRWNGEETPQFVIDKYEVMCYNKDTSFWF